MANVFNPQPKPEPIEASAAVSTLPTAWQPFTFRGVAAFAFASYNRLFWIQTVFALLCAAAIVWALHYAWTPVIRSAVRNLPNEAPTRSERLIYPSSAPPVLAESRHLAVLLRAQGGAAGSDVRVEFFSDRIRICSLFGCLVRPYPRNQLIYLTRAEAIPWWDAWEPILLGIVGILSGLCFLAIWTVLATVFFLGVRLYGYFADRNLSMGGAWRLSAAAFLPGSFALIAALILYAIGSADLIRLLIAVPGHLLIALIYLAFAPLKVDRVPELPSLGANPFASAGPPQAKGV
jgi:hypothetical protein